MLELIGGIVMGFGGSVPGVSGGTIAFLMGFFDEMIDSINAFVSKGSQNRKKAFFFLLRLGIGLVIGLIGATLLITAFFEAHIHAVSSLFIGVTLFSVPLVIYEERQTLKGKYLQALWILPGAALIVGIVLLASLGFNVSSNVLQIVMAFPAGIFSACAMIMPGISGASILYIFGLYTTFYNDVHAFLKFDFSGIVFLIVFGVGMLVGALGVVKGIKWLLSNRRASTIYAILGMMLGSIYSIVVGPSTLDPPQANIDFSNFNWLFFAIGALIIAAFEGLKLLIEKKKAKKK